MSDSIPRLNPSLTAMPRSGIREIMDGQWGRPGLIRLEVGQPDFPTPTHIVEAAHVAAMEGHTGYVATAGIPDLREALATKVRERNGYTVTPEQVTVSQGGVQGIFASLLTLTTAGDEVLIPDPAWPNYLMMATALNLRAVPYPLEESQAFMPTVETLEELVTDRTRLIVLNSPSNPLGAVTGRERTTEILDFARRHRLWVLSDECYDEIAFDGSVVSPASIDPENVVSVYSFSKTYAMTGWRLGYAVAPASVSAMLTKSQEPMLSCVSTPTQYAGIAAVTGPQEVVGVMRDAYRARRDAALAFLATTPLHAFQPEGAFYLWVDISPAGLRSRDFALRLLDERGVVVAPGTAFGARGEGHVRVSLASSEENLDEGLHRLVDLVSTLAP